MGKIKSITMKTIKLFLSFLIIITSLTFISCEDEAVDPTLVPTNPVPNNNGGGGNNGGGNPTTVVGAYKLTAFNTSVPTDLNGDGTTSTNQMNETSCFNNMFIIINSNNTFNADAKGVEIDFSNNITQCYTDPDYNGTWVLNGNILTLTYVDGGITYNDNFTVAGAGNSLSISAPDGEIVGIESGQPVYLTSNIQFIYTKQ